MSFVEAEVIDQKIRAAGCFVLFDVEGRMRMFGNGRKGAKRCEELRKYLSSDNYRRARLLRSYLINYARQTG